MIPAGLHHADLGIAERGYRAPQEIPAGHEVRIEDGDEFPLGRLETVLERARLETVAFRAADTTNPGQATTARRRILKQGVYPLGRVVGRVVEDLNLEPVRRIVQVEHGENQLRRNVALVVDWQLDRDPGQLSIVDQLEPARADRGRAGWAARPPERHEQDEPMESVDGEDAKHGVVDGKKHGR